MPIWVHNGMYDVPKDAAAMVYTLFFVFFFSEAEVWWFAV